MRALLISIILLLTVSTHAQEGSNGLSFEGYLETFYSYTNLHAQPMYDLNHPVFPLPASLQNTIMPGFMYSYNRHNEVNLNLGLMKIGYLEERVRANLGLMAGTYANSNLAHEEGVLRNVFEAYAGVKVLPFQELWLDLGVFESHIGYESAIGADNLQLTRSVKADNTPYYLSGARLSFKSKDERLEAMLLVVNGWQRIARLENDQRFGFGHRIYFKPSSKVTFNSSSYVGPIEAYNVVSGLLPPQLLGGSSVRTHYFHDFYSELKLTKRLEAILSFDIGRVSLIDDNPFVASESHRTWYAPSLDLRYALNGKCSVSARAEWFDDRAGALLASYRFQDPSSPENSDLLASGQQLYGGSICFDWAISERSLWRFEARTLRDVEPTFNSADGYQSAMYQFTTALCIRLKP